LHPHFTQRQRVSTPSIGDYQRKRLGEVQRSTIIKERSGLSRFLARLVEKEMLGEVPAFPKLAKKATGTRHKQARLAPPAELSPDEIESVLASLPVFSLRRRKGESFHVQARFIFAYETGLRPETLDKLLAQDVTVSGLHMRAELDKNRWERVLPLSARALRIRAGVTVRAGQTESIVRERKWRHWCGQRQCNWRLVGLESKSVACEECDRSHGAEARCRVSFWNYHFSHLSTRFHRKLSCAGAGSFDSHVGPL
jgi:integrase